MSLLSVKQCQPHFELVKPRVESDLVKITLEYVTNFHQFFNDELPSILDGEIVD